MAAKPRSWKAVGFNILFAYVLSVLWAGLAVGAFERFLPEIFGKAIIADVLQAGMRLPLLSVAIRWVQKIPAAQEQLAESPSLVIFMLLFFAPVVEEALFRMLPISLVQDRKPAVVRAVVIGVCGIIFGWLHGNPVNVFVQGFLGFMLGRLYLKNARSQLTSYLSCVIVHFLYNLTVVLVS